jgi:hypothetical protein
MYRDGVDKMHGLDDAAAHDVDAEWWAQRKGWYVVPSTN